jgi:hypothetical protein
VVVGLVEATLQGANAAVRCLAYGIQAGGFSQLVAEMESKKLERRRLRLCERGDGLLRKGAWDNMVLLSRLVERAVPRVPLLPTCHSHFSSYKISHHVFDDKPRSSRVVSQLQVGPPSCRELAPGNASLIRCAAILSLTSRPWRDCALPELSTLSRAFCLPYA